MTIKSDFGVIDTKPFISMGMHEEIAVFDLISNPAVAGSKEGYVHLNIVFNNSDDMVEAYHIILHGLNYGLEEVSICGHECHWDRTIAERLNNLAESINNVPITNIPWIIE